MAITPMKAAEIAKAKGLSLSDARALSAMAEDEADANKMADLFASGGGGKDEEPSTNQRVNDWIRGTVGKTPPIGGDK